MSKKIKLTPQLLEAVHHVLDQQPNAVFTGSLALYLQGVSDKRPQDLDVMVPEHHYGYLKEAQQANQAEMLRQYVSKGADNAYDDVLAYVDYMNSVYGAYGNDSSSFEAEVEQTGEGQAIITIQVSKQVPGMDNDSLDESANNTFSHSVKQTVRLNYDGVLVDFIPSECNEWVKMKIDGRDIKLKKADAVLDARRLMFNEGISEKYAEDFVQINESVKKRWPQSTYNKTNDEFAKQINEAGMAVMKQNLADMRKQASTGKAPKPVKSDTSDKKQNLSSTPDVKDLPKRPEFRGSDPGKFGNNVMSYKAFDKTAGENQPVKGKHGISHDGVIAGQNWGGGNSYDLDRDMTDQPTGSEFGPGFAHNDASGMGGIESGSANESFTLEGSVQYDTTYDSVSSFMQAVKDKCGHAVKVRKFMYDTEKEQSMDPLYCTCAMSMNNGTLEFTSEEGKPICHLNDHAQFGVIQGDFVAEYQEGAIHTKLMIDCE